ncbi:MAG: hypothetical protein ACK4TG_01400, partial [Thermaurantiacus sp.]
EGKRTLILIRYLQEAPPEERTRAEALLSLPREAKPEGEVRWLWERLLASTVVRSFETVRLELIRKVTPEGGDPVAAVRVWLGAHDSEASTLLSAMRSGRSSGAPSLAMLAHLAGLSRNALTA